MDDQPDIILTWHEAERLRRFLAVGIHETPTREGRSLSAMLVNRQQRAALAQSRVDATLSRSTKKEI